MNCSFKSRSRSEPRGRTRAALRLLVAGALLAAAPRAVRSAAAEHTRYRVVASADVPTATLTLAELRRIVLGEQRFWKNRMPLALVMPGQQTATRRFVLQRLANLSEAAYRRHVLELMYRGELEYAPKAADSDAQAASLVAAGNGAIALVRDGTALPAGVRTLQVNGHSPEDAGYPLTN